jgi:hypothetical protein
VLERTGGLISGPNGAGAVLNLHPNTLRSLMDRLGIRSPAPHSATRDDVLSNSRMLTRELSHSL